MPHSPTVIALAAVTGLAVGALLVRPAVFAYSVPEGVRTDCPCGRRTIGGSTASFLALLSARCTHRTAGPDADSARVDSRPQLQGRHRLGPAPLLPEVLTALGAAAVMSGGAHGWLLAAQLWLVTVGAVLLLVDAAVKRLPDHLTIAAAAGVAATLALAAAGGADWSALARAALAAGVVAIVFLGLALLGMGLGDAKLAPTLAAVLGWHSWTAVYYGIGAGFLLGAAQAVVLVLTRGAGRKTELAFGPALLVGALAVSAVLG